MRVRLFSAFQTYAPVLISIIFAFVAKINKETFTYIDMNIVKEYFLDTLKESMMTVVIFDTIFQFKQSERNTKRIKDIRYVYQSLVFRYADSLFEGYL